MLSKCLVVFLFFFVFNTTGANMLVDEDVRNKQNISLDIKLLGTLDMGLQTGSVSNDLHTLYIGFWNPSQTQRILADFNGDGAVNFSDFIIFASGFGRRQPDLEYNALLDLNGDGEIGFSDFLLFASAFTG